MWACGTLLKREKLRRSTSGLNMAGGRYEGFGTKSGDMKAL